MSKSSLVSRAEDVKDGPADMNAEDRVGLLWRLMKLADLFEDMAKRIENRGEK